MTFYFQRIVDRYFWPFWVSVEADDITDAHDKLALKTEGIVVEEFRFPRIINKNGRDGWGWVPHATREALPDKYEVSWDNLRPPAPLDPCLFDGL